MTVGGRGGGGGVIDLIYPGACVDDVTSCCSNCCHLHPSFPGMKRTHVLLAWKLHRSEGAEPVIRLHLRLVVNDVLIKLLKLNQEV